MNISVGSRQLEELTVRIAKQRTVTRADLELLIDKQLLQIRRVLMDATPVASTEERTFRTPQGQYVTRTKAAHTSMRQSWHKEHSGLTGKVWNDKPYAMYLFTGTQPHAIPGAFGYPAPFGDNPDFHPGTKQNDRLVAAFEGQIVDASTRFRQFGYEVAGKIAGVAVKV